MAWGRVPQVFEPAVERLIEVVAQILPSAALALRVPTVRRFVSLDELVQAALPVDGTAEH